MNPKLSQLESRWKFAKGWCDEEEWVDKVELEGIVKVGTAERPECFDKIEMVVGRWKDGGLEDVVEMEEVGTCWDSSWDYS